MLVSGPRGCDGDLPIGHKITTIGTQGDPQITVIGLHRFQSDTSLSAVILLKVNRH